VREDFPGHSQDAGDRFVQRRAVPRYSMIVEVEVFEPIQGNKLTAHIADIGANGCYVRVPAPLQRDAVIQLLILKDKESFKTWGRVVHTHEGIGMGIAFFRPEPDQEKILQGWIASLKAQQPNH
jgi:hypothetical protein